MTDMEHHFRAARDQRAGVAQLLFEYALVAGFLILIGALALAEASGMLDGLVHNISFLA